MSHACSEAVIALQNISVKSQGSRHPQRKSWEPFGHCSYCRQSTGGGCQPHRLPHVRGINTQEGGCHTRFLVLTLQPGKGWSSCLREVRRLNWTDTRKRRGIFSWRIWSIISQSGSARTSKKAQYSKWDLLPLSSIRKEEIQGGFRHCLVLSCRNVSWGTEERNELPEEGDFRSGSWWQRK